MGTLGNALLDIDAILSNSGIRPHIKSIVISLLGALDDPVEDEWRLLEPLLASELSNHVLRSIHGSAPWFDLLDTIGELDRWLNGNDETLVSRAIWLMHGVLRDRSDRVARLLTPFLGNSASWDQRLVSTVLSADLETSRDMFDLYLAMVNSGSADDALTGRNNYSPLWHTAYAHLLARTAEWACELVSACCNRLLARARAAGDTNPFDARSGPSSSGRTRCATGCGQGAKNIH